MGYYTKLKCDVTLNNDTPEEILDILEKLSSGDMWNELAQDKFGKSVGGFSVEEQPELPIDHIFGKSHRWSQIFNTATTVFNRVDKTLKINCEIKAYDEIYDHLVDWFTPYIYSGLIKTKGEDNDTWYIDILK